MRRRQGLRKSFPKFVLLISLACVSLLFVMAFTLYNNNLLFRLYANNKLKSVSQGLEFKTMAPKDYYETKYSSKSSQQTVESGERGTGINLLLINNIQTEGYAKEMLELYKQSAEGKLNDNPYHMGVETYLGVQVNETSGHTYNGTLIPKSYIPFDRKSMRILWGEPFEGISGDKLKLSSLNKNVINTAPVEGGRPSQDKDKLPYEMNGINKTTNGLVYNTPPSRDIGYFQINRQQFYNTGNSTTVLPAKMSGFGESQDRNSDAYYLPDMLSALDGMYSQMMKSYDFSNVDKTLTYGAYAIYHNGGPGVLSGSASFGTRDDEKKISLYSPKLTAEQKKEYSENAVVIPRDILMGATDKQGELSTVPKSPEYSKTLATLILLNKGYYLTQGAYDNLTGHGSMNISKALVYSWKLVNGEELSFAEVATKLLAYKKTVDQVYPEMTSSVMDVLYSQKTNMDIVNGDGNNYGTIWKLEEATSSIYTNTFNGIAPRIFRYTNQVTAGHMFDTMMTGRYIYANLLAYAGLNVDAINPSSYMSELSEDTFKPEGGNFDRMLKRIGITDINPNAYAMLKWAYDRAGFYYYLGGGARIVSKENYSYHYGFVTYGSNPEENALDYLTNQIYVTKDGHSGNANTPNSDLLYYGRYLFDCSSLTGGAYNATVGEATGTSLSFSSYDQLSDTSALKTINDWSQAKPGDLFVTKGHVFFYLATNTSAGSVDLSRTDAKTEGKARTAANTNEIWVLEASTSREFVGVRVRSLPPKDKYVLRRLVKVYE